LIVVTVSVVFGDGALVMAADTGLAPKALGRMSVQHGPKATLKLS